MNTLLLHIGTSKTATSSLQKLLYDNNSALKKAGWCYPDLMEDYKKLRGGFDNGDHVKNGLILTNGLWNKKAANKIVWSIIRSYLKKYSVIISDECFWEISRVFPNYSIGQFLSEYVAYYSQIKVIVYLRRQEEYCESLWNQFVKENNCSYDFQEYISKNEWIEYTSDYYGRLCEIERIIGKENIIVRVFEKGQFAGDRKDIFSDFIYCLNSISNRQICAEQLNYPERINERLDGFVFETRRVFNRKYVEKCQESNTPTQMIFQEYNEKWNKNNKMNYSYISSGTKQTINTKYLDCNRKVAKHFCEHEQLFFEGVAEKELYIDTFSNRELFLVELFSDIVNEKEKVIAEMGKKPLLTGIKKAARCLSVYTIAFLKRIICPISSKLFRFFV